MTETNAPVSLSQWKKAAVHSVRCPSGVWIEIKIPDLASLIEAGDIPQHLLEEALKATGEANAASDSAPTKEFMMKEREFTNAVVLATVVTPKLTENDVTSVPVEDKAMIVEIATRQRDIDVEGNHIGGLHTSEAFRKFRGLDSFDSPLENL